MPTNTKSDYILALSNKAKKDLDSIPQKYSPKISKALRHLRSYPFSGKKLVGKFAELYSYRVWPFRIIYRPYKKNLIVIVIRIGHRKSVYR